MLRLLNELDRISLSVSRINPVCHSIIAPRRCSAIVVSCSYVLHKGTPSGSSPGFIQSMPVNGT